MYHAVLGHAGQCTLRNEELAASCLAASADCAPPNLQSPRPRHHRAVSPGTLPLRAALSRAGAGAGAQYPGPACLWGYAARGDQCAGLRINGSKALHVAARTEPCAPSLPPFPQLTDSELAGLREDPRIKSIHANSRVHPQAAPGLQVQRGAPWNLARLDQPGLGSGDKSYSYTSDGTGVNVYVLDTVRLQGRIRSPSPETLQGLQRHRHQRRHRRQRVRA